MEKEILDWIEEQKSELVSVSDKIWGYAELGLDEHKSAKLQMDYLRSQGFDIKSGIGLSLIHI